MKSDNLSVFERGLQHISDACIFLGSCAMAVLIVIFGWLVFGRYVLNVTPTWVEQLALILVCYIAFLGAAAGIHESTHLGVTFIRESFPLPVKRLLRLITDIALAGFGFVMMVACIDLVQFGWATKLPMLDVPEGIRTLPAAICGGLTFLFAGSRALGVVVRGFARSENQETQGDQG